jgi:hypothetical protein
MLSIHVLVQVALLEHLIASSGKHDQSLTDHLLLCRQQQQRLERHASMIQKRAAVQTARLALSAAKSKVRVSGNNANERYSFSIRCLFSMVFMLIS